MNSSVYPLNVIAGQIYLVVVILKALTAKMCLFFGIHTFEWIARYRKAVILIWFLFFRKCAVINFSGKNVFIFLKSLNLNGHDNFFLNTFLDLIIISKLVDVHFWTFVQSIRRCWDIHVPRPFHLVPKIDLGSRLFMTPCCYFGVFSPMNAFLLFRRFNQCL